MFEYAKICVSQLLDFINGLNFARSTKVCITLNSQLCLFCVLPVTQLPCQVFSPQFILSGLERMPAKNWADEETPKLNSSNETKVCFPLHSGPVWPPVSVTSHLCTVVQEHRWLCYQPMTHGSCVYGHYHLVIRREKMKDQLQRFPLQKMKQKCTLLWLTVYW